LATIDPHIDPRLAHLDVLRADQCPELAVPLSLSAGPVIEFPGLQQFRLSAFSRDTEPEDDARRAAAELTVSIEAQTEDRARESAEAQALRAAEEALGAARQAVADAKQAMADGRRGAEQGGFSPGWTAAIGKLHDDLQAAEKVIPGRQAEVAAARSEFTRRRIAIRRQLVAEYGQDLPARRETLRVKAAAAAAEFGRELFALCALEQALKALAEKP
jgi:hypothetical protein